MTRSSRILSHAPLSTRGVGHRRTLTVGLSLAAFAMSCSSAEGDSTAAEIGSSSASAAETGLDASPNDAAPPSLVAGTLPDSLAPLSSVFSKHIDVWGVDIVGTTSTDDAKMLHAANVMAQYLDNDADGSPDNQAVVDAMVANNAILLMAQTPDEFGRIDVDEVFDFVGQGGQDLYGSETAPAGGFDASLEEVHHLILNTGWATVFPDQLAQIQGSAIATAMDAARGGRFDTVPDAYPTDAWYTYDDETCDYTCMITEYTYWAHTGLLGAQAGRADEIADEWKLTTSDEVRSGDPAAAALLTDPALGLPTVLPDGNYRAV